jgi:hypothetical protein
LPGSPLLVACAQHAPKSRFVVSGLAWEKINGNGNTIGNGNGKAGLGWFALFA